MLGLFTNLDYEGDTSGQTMPSLIAIAIDFVLAMTLRASHIQTDTVESAASLRSFTIHRIRSDSP